MFLYDAAKTSLLAVGTSDTPMGVHQRQLGLAWLPIANGGRTVDVFQTGQPYHSGRVDEDYGELRGIRDALGVRSAIIVPLVVGGTRRGVLAASSSHNDHFSSDNAQFLHTVARWVSTVMQRAELIDRLTREATEHARQLIAEK